MRKVYCVCFVIVIAFIFAACGAKAPELSLPDDFWRFVDGSTATIPISEALYQRFAGQGEIVHNKTYNAYCNLLSGEARLIFTLEPSPDVLQMFTDADVAIDIIPIVKDAFVLFVNDKNPVRNLTVSQLRDIYTGNIVNWRRVGGEDLTIIPYQRNEAAGSQALFLMLLMQDEKPLSPPTEYIQGSMKDIIDSVAVADRGRAAIGYNVFYYANIMYENENIRLLQVDGVEPSQASIISGEYPLDTHYYAVIRKDAPPNDPARQLIDFILSDEGQALMQETGYVPLQRPDDR
jgi:phosphate transport system substrate-binding protein